MFFRQRKQHHESGTVTTGINGTVTTGISNYPINFIADPINTSFSREYLIKLKKDSFEKVDILLEERSKIHIQEVEKDSYLFEYSDNELIDIIKNKDEWNSFDVSLAKNILKDKGIILSNEEIENFKTQRLNKLSEPEKSQNSWG